MKNFSKTGFYKALGIIAITAIIGIGLAGCASSGKARPDLRGTTTAGQVTAINGSKISVTLGTLSSGGGDMPSEPPGALPPDMSGEPPDGNGGMPPLMPGGGRAFTARDGNVTITINAKTIITKEVPASGPGAAQAVSAGLSDISKGSVLLISFDADNSVTAVTIVNTSITNTSGGGFGGGSRIETSGTAVTIFNSAVTKTGESYTSAKTDENAVRVENRAAVIINNAALTKTGDSSSTEDSDFYGMNAGVLVRGRAALTISGGTFTTNASGGNAIFVYGEGSKAVIRDAVIRTTKNNSGGIELAGGGTIEAVNLDINTNGNSAAALRSDRGGGNMTVNGGVYVTNGTGSPAIYSTAQISVANAALTATRSEAVVVEGKNSVELTNCTLTGSMAGTYGSGSGENIQNVMIYQSMSGDASIGRGSFTMSGGSLVSKNGDTFYVTNTSALINLSGVAVTNANGNLLKVAGNDGKRGWGQVGKNGGTVEFNAANQALSGSIIVDSISTLTLTLIDNSSFTGSINTDADGQSGNVSVSLDGSSRWTLTGNAYITAFNGNSNNITANGFHVYVNGAILK